MKKIKRMVSLVLLVLVVVCSLIACVKVPENEISFNIVASKGTYIRDEGHTELFLLFDVLNGKKRDIKSFEFDAVITLKDGTQKTETYHFDQEIRYLKSSPLTLTLIIEGRAEHFEIVAFRHEIKTYWGSFGGLIIGAVIIYIVLGIIMLVFSMAELDGLLSILAVLIIGADVVFLIFMPFTKAIIMILASLLSFVPYVIYQINGGY